MINKKYIVVRVNMNYDCCEGVTFISSFGSLNEADNYIQSLRNEYLDSFKNWEQYNNKYIQVVCLYNKNFYNIKLGYHLGDAHDHWYTNKYGWHSNPIAYLKPYYISNAVLNKEYEEGFPKYNNISIYDKSSNLYVMEMLQ